MMTEREALNLALEILEECYDLVFEKAEEIKELHGDYPPRQNQVKAWVEMCEKHAAAIKAIKEALAQPEQKPVAWVQDVEFEQTPEFAFSWVKTDLHNVPLYTTPPHLKRLTDIESAHGIKESK